MNEQRGDIVERLRSFHGGPPLWAETMHEAAKEIEKLRTANEYAFGPAGELAKCRAETERLKAALRDMLHAIGHDRKELVDGAADRARVTLEEK